MKKLLFLLLLVSSSVFAQKVEHGILAGASLGFPLQDKNETPAPPASDFFLYNNDLFGGGMIGYRFRFFTRAKIILRLGSYCRIPEHGSIEIQTVYERWRSQ